MILIKDYDRAPRETSFIWRDSSRKTSRISRKSSRSAAPFTSPVNLNRRGRLDLLEANTQRAAGIVVPPADRISRRIGRVPFE